MKKLVPFIAIMILLTGCSRTGKGYGFPVDAVSGEIHETELGCFYLPSGYSPEKKYPLIVLLHGLGTSSRMFMISNEWIPQAEKRGYILCAPKSEKYYWDDSPGCSDIGNIHRFIQIISRQYSVRRDKICLYGFSNGGHFTNIMMVYNRPWWKGRPYINAFVEGSGGSSNIMEKYMRKGKLPKRLRVPVYIFWGDREVPHPGENVSIFLKEQYWDVIVEPHPGAHELSDVYLEKAFNWLDSKIP